MPRTLTTLALCAALSAGTLTLAAPASADHVQVADDREVLSYTVLPGDTATGLATRFHAWTAELVALNHLGPDARLRVGQRLRIPVVRTATPRDRRDAATSPPSREEVRSTVVRLSRRHGVDPQLGLAVAWQESGWQMQHTSSAGAIGAMQVLRGTVDWMETYAGRPLRPRRLRDNVEAGVLLLRLLEDLTDSRRHQVAAYYQGLGAVRRHGLYDESVRYVANVLAIKRRLEQGRPPA